MALKLDISVDDFMNKYTRRVGKGATSRFELKEIRVANSRSYDCVFLDRSSIPGKAICALYDAQCVVALTIPIQRVKSHRDTCFLPQICHSQLVETAPEQIDYVAI